MEDLGELGFWLAVGIVLAAMIVSGAQKERERERQKQETLRALLTAEDKSTAEILQYMRERDAAEAAQAHAQWVAMGGNMSGRSAAALTGASIIGGLSFVGGMFSFAHLGGRESGFLPIVTMLGIWVGGLIVAFLIYLLIYFLLRERKQDKPGA